jgi:hypothetical protein
LHATPDRAATSPCRIALLSYAQALSVGMTACLTKRANMFVRYGQGALEFLLTVNGGFCVFCYACTVVYACAAVLILHLYLAGNYELTRR